MGGSGLYASLITSGIGLTEGRLAELVAAGLDHVQLSFQDSREGPADEIAGNTRTCPQARGGNVASGYRSRSR